MLVQLENVILLWGRRDGVLDVNVMTFLPPDSPRGLRERGWQVCPRRPFPLDDVLSLLSREFWHVTARLLVSQNREEHQHEQENWSQPVSHFSNPLHSAPTAGSNPKPG